jgi:transcriptional regulator with GAF, ATPase, and Fis domain
MPTPFDQMLASAVLEMTGEASVPATLERVVALVLDTVESCDAAAVLLFDRTPVTVVASDESLRELVAEHVQRESAPAWTARTHQEPVYSGNLARDFRWPTLGEELSGRLGIHSVYALPLTLTHQSLGVLVAYGKAVDAFDAEEQETARILAMHATAVLADAIQQRHLQTALDSRTVIGQATGIVMERFGLDASAAFGVLRRLSQTENVKLRDVAAKVVETGRVG